jgi:hypothetical protein
MFLAARADGGIGKMGNTEGERKREGERERESGVEYRGIEGERKPWKKHVRRERKEAHVF